MIMLMEALRFQGYKLHEETTQSQDYENYFDHQNLSLEHLQLFLCIVGVQICVVASPATSELSENQVLE